jgi:hypothetical protein
VLEVPHEGRGIEEADGGDAQTGMGDGAHTFLDYSLRAKDSRGVFAAWIRGYTRDLTYASGGGNVGGITKESGFWFPVKKAGVCKFRRVRFCDDNNAPNRGSLAHATVG